MRRRTVEVDVPRIAAAYSIVTGVVAATAVSFDTWWRSTWQVPAYGAGCTRRERHGWPDRADQTAVGAVWWADESDDDESCKSARRRVHMYRPLPATGGPPPRCHSGGCVDPGAASAQHGAAVV